MGLINDKKPIGRPKNRESTETKTWAFYSADVQDALNNDWQPKHVFRMGITALKGNPQFIDRMNKSEEGLSDLNTRLERLVAKVNSLSSENWKMREQLERLGIKFDEVVANAEVS